jgi:hypothetical protein
VKEIKEAPYSRSIESNKLPSFAAVPPRYAPNWRFFLPQLSSLFGERQQVVTGRHAFAPT